MERAVRAGVRVLAVTDHDTVAGLTRAADACRTAGIEFVPGIEVTAMVNGLDVHVLGYFIDHASPGLLAFLAQQRRSRTDRVRLMVERLRTLGFDLDPDAILQPALADTSTSAGRPWIARALVEAGHVPDISAAFDRWLGAGRPAFVPRNAPPPAVVIARIHEADGIASLAHPGLLKHDEWIPDFTAAGLDALEVFHSEHGDADVARYDALADRLGLAKSGGSDFHGDNVHHVPHPGAISLPQKDYDRLKAKSTPR